MNIINSDVLHLRLINNEQVVAKFGVDFGEEIEVDFPMLIEPKSTDGSTAISLVKYLPFNFEQKLAIKKDHIVAMSVVTHEFAKYYYNSVHYQEIYVAPATASNIKRINQSLEVLLSDENQEFLDLVKKHQARIPIVPLDTH